MAHFVGAGRRELVDRLQERLVALCRGDDVPRIMVLEGETGAGKSRIIREFYERLRDQLEPESGADAASDAMRPYWPPLSPLLASGAIREDVAGGRLDPLPERKVIGPRTEGFLWPAHSLPAFAWWALSCDRLPSGGGQQAGATADFSEWWEVHGDALTQAWGARASLGEKVKAHKDVVIEGLKEDLKDGGIEAVGHQMAHLGVSGFGLGIVLTNVGRVINRVRDRRERRQAFTEEREFERYRTSDAQLIVASLKEIARPDLPVVLALEDAHLLHADMVALLEALGRPDPAHPILTIATAWPEGALVEHRWRTFLGDAVVSGGADVVRLPPLAVEDRAAIVIEYAPAHTAGDAIVQEVAARWTTPLALELIMTDRAVAEDIAEHGGAITFSCEELLRNLPSELDQIYAHRWDSLPAEVKGVLAVTRASLPPGLGTEPFVRSIVVEALGGIAGGGLAFRRIKNVPLDAFETSLDSAADCNWIRAVDEAPHDATPPTTAADALGESPEMFAEYQVAQTVRSQMPGVLGDVGQVIPALQQSIVDVLCRHVNDARQGSFTLIPDEATDLLAQWLVGLSEGAEAAPAALAAAQHICGWRASAEGRPVDAIGLFRAALSKPAVDPMDTEVLVVRLQLANVYRASGDLDSSLREAEGVLAHLEGTGIPDAWIFRLFVRRSITRTLRAANRIDEAIDQMRAILAEPEVRSGLPSLWHGIQLELADALCARHDYQDAIAACDVLLLEGDVALDPRSRDRLTARALRARALHGLGQKPEALALQEALLDEVVDALGRDDRLALRLRAAIAVGLDEAGRLREALEMLRDLQVDAARALDDDDDILVDVQKYADAVLNQAGLMSEMAAAKLMAPGALDGIWEAEQPPPGTGSIDPDWNRPPAE